MDALNFYALTLPVRHQRHRIDVLGENKLPLVDVLADDFVGFPTKQTFRRRGPARHPKVAVPLDDGERRAFDVKRELPVSSLCRVFCLALRADIAHDRDAAGDVVVLVDQGRVATREYTRAGRSIRMRF